ncbi:MAG: hypothetical protein K8S14_10575 [Actinomycetia bacterium]|nr:hypothetical protein [Actinomycetes bacterium]
MPSKTLFEVVDDITVSLESTIKAVKTVIAEVLLSMPIPVQLGEDGKTLYCKTEETFDDTIKVLNDSHALIKKWIEQSDKKSQVAKVFRRNPPQGRWRK